MLKYEVELTDEGHVAIGILPTQDILPARGLRLGVQIDSLPMHDASFQATPGKHTLKLIMIDPEVVIEQIVVNPDNSRYSYFGAPERKNIR